MKTFVITPSTPRTYGIVDEEGSNGMSQVEEVGLGEKFYWKPWFFTRMTHLPHYLFQYSKLFIFRAGWDCILGTRKIVAPEDAPTRSLHNTTDFVTQMSSDVTSPSHFGGSSRIWNDLSAGLCIMLPGLNAHPTMFTELCEEILSLNPAIDFYTPDLVEMDEEDASFWLSDSDDLHAIEQSYLDPALERTGIYQGQGPIPKTKPDRRFKPQRHAERILLTVRSYLEPYKSNPQKIILIGFSKGSYVQTFLDAAIQREFPACRVAFISIGGVFSGTRLVDKLNNYGLGVLVGTDEDVDDLLPYSNVSISVLNTLRGAYLASHEYDFFASTRDEYVWPFTSSLPIIPQSCRHHLFTNENHNGLLKASTPKVKEIIKRFIE